MDSNKLLLVEDHNDVREVCRMILTAQGYDVTECPDGKSAVAKANDCLPDIAIIDIGLPDINGYQVASQIRQIEDSSAKKRSILVALIGRGEVPSQRQSFEAGFDLYFTKPVELKTVCAELKAIQIAARDHDKSDAA